MPNVMDIGFSFPTYINILEGAARQMKRRNCDKHSEPGPWGTPHRTDCDQDGQIFWTGGASPATQPRCTRRSSLIQAGQDAQVRRRRRRVMMTFAALVVTAILVVSILYAMFSRTR
jgi:hypothetical protein